MKITGSGVINAGQYEDISVYGNGRITGNINCTELKCSGALKTNGDVISSGDVQVSGTMRGDGNLKGKDIKISGSCTVADNIIASEEISVSGTLKTEGIIKATKITISGTASAKSGMEAEEIKIDGKITTEGLVNAEKIDISLAHAENKIFGIGGSEINIYPGKFTALVGKVPLFAKLVGTKIGRLEITDSIEGDIVKIAATKCPTVIGREVTIGAGSEIECVKYIDSIDISMDAKVAKSEKI